LRRAVQHTLRHRFDLLERQWDLSSAFDGLGARAKLPATQLRQLQFEVLDLPVTLDHHAVERGHILR